MTRIFIFLSILPFICAMFFYNILPDTIPMHFDFKNNIDRYASKVEIFIFPFIILIYAFLFNIFIKVIEKNISLKILNIIYCILKDVLIYFNILNLLILYSSLKPEHIKLIIILTFSFFIILLIKNIYLYYKNNSKK